ncbi:hypothetical protein [Treponema sp. J25]|uniref:hypothetical protein n=1 Tax=Treponema sp. J25 TaxID=2094121 RepID=UPI00104BD8DE|nr:hypothetical protein [Treponema sp. J25]TCW61827.1 hypothetical protein C5O22_03600 [Treponema sp. J25]
MKRLIFIILLPLFSLVLVYAQTELSGRIYFLTIEDFDPTNTKDSSLGGGFADGRSALQGIVYFDNKSDYHVAHAMLEADKASLMYAYEAYLTGKMGKLLNLRDFKLDITATTGAGTNKTSRIGYLQFSRIYDRVGSNITTGIGTNNNGIPFVVSSDIGVKEFSARIAISPGYWTSTTETSGTETITRKAIPFFAGFYGNVWGINYETYYTYNGSKLQGVIFDGTYNLSFSKENYVTIGFGLNTDVDGYTSTGDRTSDWLYYGIDLLFRFKALGLTVETGGRGNVKEGENLVCTGLAIAYGIPVIDTGLKLMGVFDTRKNYSYNVVNVIGMGFQKKIGAVTYDVGYYYRPSNAASMGDLGIERTFLTVLKGIDAYSSAFYFALSYGF